MHTLGNPQFLGLVFQVGEEWLVLTEEAMSVPLVSSTDALATKTVKLATGEHELPARR